VGGFREGFEGAQDWDCVLRYTKELKPNQIKHIPEILYHWRAISTSTAASAEAKPYVFQAQQRAVREHLPGVDVGYDIDYQHVVVTYPSASPLVSVIIPTKDKKELLEVCVNGLVNKTNYKNLEIIIIDNGSTDQEAIEYLRTLPKTISYVKVIRDDGPFNFSRLNNRAAREAKGELLLFLNNDIEVVEPEWLTEMVSLAVRPDTGAVGAKLLYPDGRIQHAGVILGIGGVAGHSHKYFQGSDPGYFKRNILRHSVSAVTAACLLIKAELFHKVNGFDEKHLAVAFNDVDFCLKVRELGFRNIYTPYATLLHHESVSRGHEDSPEKIARFSREIKYMQKKWDLKNDPYYNPNLTDVSEDFTLAFPPRRHKLWAYEG
jgi:GT2 family glycosyltransferase